MKIDIYNLLYLCLILRCTFKDNNELIHFIEINVDLNTLFWLAFISTTNHSTAPIFVHTPTRLLSNASSFRRQHVIRICACVAVQNDVILAATDSWWFGTAVNTAGTNGKAGYVFSGLTSWWGNKLVKANVGWTIWYYCEVWESIKYVISFVFLLISSIHFCYKKHEYHHFSSFSKIYLLI